MTPFEVLCDSDPPRRVYLEPRAPAPDVAHALSAIGIYAPRGADRLEWLTSGLAFIDTVEGAQLVLREAEPLEVLRGPGYVHAAIRAPVRNDNGTSWELDGWLRRRGWYRSILERA